MNNSAGTFLVMSDAQPYTLLGQAGQCSAVMEYQIPSSLSDKPVDPSIDLHQASALFPSFSLLQVAVDGRGVDAVRPDQAGRIRLVLFDPDSGVTSVKLSLLPASGEEIDLPVTTSGGQEYTGAIPPGVQAGFIDVVARVEDTKGNTCELTASPAFFFGTGTDTRKLDARLRMSSSALTNVERVTFASGDTLHYLLTYINYGSDTARNVVVTFPTTPFLRPIGPSTWTIDAMRVHDTVHVPVCLVFLGKQQSTDTQTHYSPSVAWTSGETVYRRSHNILVDFQNSVTDVTQTRGLAPRSFELYQNYPNPFNPKTVISGQWTADSYVRLTVFDLLGRSVAVLADGRYPAGKYTFAFDGTNLASGVYFYRLTAGSFSAVRRMLLIR